MTNAVSTTPPRARRSQHERSASARFALISATLDCLMEIGVAKTSITEICKRAGLSRGALLHHFPHKNELLVASYMVWLEGKLATLEARLQPAAGVRDEVAAWRAQMKETFSMTQEFYWALRNDRDLRERFNAALLTHPVGDDASDHLPRTRIDASRSPELTRYVIACFIRGLCFQELFVRDHAIPDRAFEHFVDMLDAFLDQPSADSA
ncbi:TetR/AcrR family transcriptional regulator [Burkholderia sp. F1]|uniref:TetR/AcrR family transcriptional regulator n=1 Tax=Burkholderia sp. F1 TaxID=3366817 RepID=UPI003D74EC39